LQEFTGKGTTKHRGKTNDSPTFFQQNLAK